MQLPFVKMHGLGNDFVIFDGMRQEINLSREQIRRLAQRRFGIGCDQVLLLEAPDEPGADVRYRIFNADGAEVEQCGNGARCVAKFLRARGLVPAERGEIIAKTAKGRLKLVLDADGEVTVDMGVPNLEPAQIPLAVPDRAPRYRIPLGGRIFLVGGVSMGNPHAVLEVEDVERAPVADIGARLAAHPLFPEGVNVGFMQVQDRRHLCLRVFERGVGETLACGSGACAAVVIGRLWSLLDASVEVSLPGGRLEIHWEGEGETVSMKGPATHVFEGTIDI